MKNTFFVCVVIFSFLRCMGQHYGQGYCAEKKSKLFSGKNRVQYLPFGYQPPESKYDVKFYHLNLNLETDTGFIGGNVKSLASVVVSALDSFAFVLHKNYAIDSVYINGAKHSFIRQDSLVKVDVGIPIPMGQLFETVVYYKGLCAPQDGLGYNINPGSYFSYWNEVAWTKSEPFGAYLWFPCKQDLRDKIDSSWVSITTDSTNMVGSNGILKNVVIAGNKKRYEWRSSNPIDYYLISIAISNYKQYNLYAKPANLNGDSVLIQNFIYTNLFSGSSWNSEKLKLDKIVPTIELLSTLYGVYPFYKEKYGHCMATVGGAMEHQTMTTTEFINAEINAHELGHQWWGDNVTCAAWKDIFMNEGWASYTEYLYHQYLSAISGNTATNKMNAVHNGVMSQPGGSSYISNADTMNANVIFDGRLTYDKGSAIIHSLRYEINNDSTFFNAIRSFQNTYRASTASVIDFRVFMENYTGQNFVQFFNQWYYGQGYPTFSLQWNQSSNVFYLKSTQTQSMPSATPLFMTHVDYKISRTAMADTIVRLYHGQAVENYSFALTGSVTAIVVDPNNWILNKVGTITKNTALSTNELEGPVAKVFIGPNPTSDVLNIYLYNNDKATVEVFDISGRHVMNQTISAHGEFDVSKFANGVYTVNVKDMKGNVIRTAKVVKN